MRQEIKKEAFLKKLRLIIEKVNIIATRYGFFVRTERFDSPKNVWNCKYQNNERKKLNRVVQEVAEIMLSMYVRLVQRKMFGEKVVRSKNFRRKVSAPFAIRFSDFLRVRISSFILRDSGHSRNKGKNFT
jgi:hypothetical protein